MSWPTYDELIQKRASTGLNEQLFSTHIEEIQIRVSPIDCTVVIELDYDGEVFCLEWFPLVSPPDWIAKAFQIAEERWVRLLRMSQMRYDCLGKHVERYARFKLSEDFNKTAPAIVKALLEYPYNPGSGNIRIILREEAQKRNIDIDAIFRNIKIAEEML